MRRDFETIGSADEMIKRAVPPADNILGFVASLENLGFPAAFRSRFVSAAGSACRRASGNPVRFIGGRQLARFDRLSGKF